MAADQSVETGQPLSVVYESGIGTLNPLVTSVRFWARNLAGETVLGGPANVQDPINGVFEYDGVAPAVAGELIARFTATYSDGHTRSFPFPGGLIIEVLEPNPTKPMYAGLGDLEAALGRPIPADQRGYAIYMLEASTVAIDAYCCRSFAAPVPDEVRLACAGMAADTYGQGASADGSGGGPIVQESIGDYSVRYADPSIKMNSAANMPSIYGFEYMLKRYRLCGLHSISTTAEKTYPYIQRTDEPWARQTILDEADVEPWAGGEAPAL